MTHEQRTRIKQAISEAVQARIEHHRQLHPEFYCRSCRTWHTNYVPNCRTCMTRRWKREDRSSRTRLQTEAIIGEPNG